MEASDKICRCKFKILIVDDNEFNLLVLSQLIKKLQIDANILRLVRFKEMINEADHLNLLNNQFMIKFDVDEACNGIQAVEFYQKNL